MKINKLFNARLLFVAYGFMLLIGCSENDDFGADTDKVVATIFDFSGSSLVNVNDVVEFSVTQRPGSVYTWEVDGAEIQPIEGVTHKVNVSFNEVGLSTIHVFETTIGGFDSLVTSQDVNVLQLCDWSIDMRDSYGDGWNGASIEISFSGNATIEPVTLTLEGGASEIKTFTAPSGYTMTVFFTSGDYDEEIAYQIRDASESPVFTDGVSANPVAGEVFTTTVTCP